MNVPLEPAATIGTTVVPSADDDDMPALIDIAETPCAHAAVGAVEAVEAVAAVAAVTAVVAT
jgi:hypothetical protein